MEEFQGDPLVRLSCCPGVWQVDDDGGVHGEEVDGAGRSIDKRRSAVGHHAITFTETETPPGMINTHEYFYYSAVVRRWNESTKKEGEEKEEDCDRDSADL